MTPVDSLNSCKTVRICTQYTLPHKIAKQWSSPFLNVVSPFIFLSQFTWKFLVNYPSSEACMVPIWAPSHWSTPMEAQKSKFPGEKNTTTLRTEPRPMDGTLVEEWRSRSFGFFFDGAKKPIPEVEPKWVGNLKNTKAALKGSIGNASALGSSLPNSWGFLSRNQLWGGSKCSERPWKWLPKAGGFIYIYYICIY